MQVVLSSARSNFDQTVLSTRVPTRVIEVVDDLARLRKKSRAEIVRDIVIRRLVDAKLIVLVDDADYRL